MRLQYGNACLITTVLEKMSVYLIICCNLIFTIVMLIIFKLSQMLQFQKTVITTAVLLQELEKYLALLQNNNKVVK